MTHRERHIVYRADGPGDYRLLSVHPDYVSAATELARLRGWEAVNVPAYRRSEYRVVTERHWREHFAKEAIR